MKSRQPFYQSYLLRLWWEQHEGSWRVTLQHVTTGNCQHFAGLEALFRYLNEQTRPLSNTHMGETGPPQTQLENEHE